MALPSLAFYLLVVTFGGVEARSQPNDPKSSAPETASSSPSSSQNTGNRRVGEVRLSGLQRLEEKTVRAWLKAREGAPYTAQDRQADVRTLLATGEFSSVHVNEVEISTGTVRLEFAFSEIQNTPSVSTSTIARIQASPSGGHRAIPPPWVVTDIVIQGGRRTNYNTLRSDLKVRKGELYEKSDMEKDVQTLIGLGSFERVTADVAEIPGKPVPPQFAGIAGSTNTVRLTFLVEEKSIIRKIRFEGNKGLSKGKLSDKLTLKEKDPLSESKLREDTNNLLQLYHEKGFSGASVEPKVSIDTRAAEGNITFLIQEGPQTKVSEVIVSGLRAFKLKKIQKQMENRPKKVFQENKLFDDFKKIEALYKNNGYLDFKISSHTFSISEDKSKVKVSLAFEEGRSYKFGSNDFSGYTVYASSTLAKAIDYKEGKIFNQEKLDESVRNLQELYADKGYLRARITPEKNYNPKTDEMDVRFNIVEDRIVYIDHVDVEGNHSAKTYVFKREITIKPGDPFSSSKIRRSREKIMNLGFIDDVDVDIQSPSDPTKADLTFDVKEGKPGMLTAGAGFSSIDKLVGTLSVQHMDLFGRAQRASLSAQFGARLVDYTASWTTPWVGDHPTSFGVDLFNTRRISPFNGDINAYTQKRLGGTLRLGPRFENDKYLLNLNYTLQRITITGLDNQFQPGGAFAGELTEGTSVSSSLGADFSRITLDNIWDPTRGTKNTLGFSITGGPLQGTINLWKPYIANAAHFHLLSVEDYPLVLSVLNRASYVTPFGTTKEVPVFDRFYVGGQDSLRGYNANGEAGYPNGGKFYDVFNMELGFPLAREHHKSIVKLVGFFDAGSAWDNVRSATWRIGPAANDIKTDIGLGIRFVTPAFPIRLDYGYGLNHPPGQKSYQINFGLGPLF